MNTRPDLPRTIGFWGATAIMVGIVIGSGIFRTPTDVAGHTGSPAFILWLWAIGGVLSLFGALTYAELAVMYPESGGVYVFLREGLGRAVALVFGWTYLLISKPLAAAGIAVIFAEHFNQLTLGYTTPFANSMTTSALLIVLTALNVCGLRLGSGVAGVLTSLKVLALLAIIGLALSLFRGDADNFQATPSPLDSPWWLALAPIMASVMWTYDGWSDVGSIAGEVREPNRMLPRIFLVGTAALIGIYVAVNAVYIWLVPLSEMRASGTVAPLVMQRLIGESGAIAVALVVLISTLGSTHGSIITGARITFAQARDGLLFRFLARVHPRYQTPAVALWFQCLLSCIAVWYYGNFNELAGGFVFTMWIFYGLAGAVIFIMRRRFPDAPRPYRCWGYPVVPALFVLASIAMTVLSIIDNPKNTAIWLGFLAAGLPVYWFWKPLSGSEQGP
jgi:basic amino acid/polyamine antiporter, APA family